MGRCWEMALECRRFSGMTGALPGMGMIFGVVAGGSSI